MTKESNRVEGPDAIRERRWQRRAESRPGEILDAALEVLAERGYARGSMAEVARRSGVSKGTVYVYFPTKADLVAALMAQAPEELSARFEEVEPNAGARERVRRLMEEVWAVVSTPRVSTLYRVLSAEPSELRAQAAAFVRELTDRATTALAEAIRAGVDAGAFRRVEPYMAGRMIVALVFQHAGWRQAGALTTKGRPMKEADVLAQVEDFYLAALAPS